MNQTLPGDHSKADPETRALKWWQSGLTRTIFAVCAVLFGIVFLVRFLTKIYSTAAEKRSHAANTTTYLG